MTNSNIAHRRLHYQHVSSPLERPTDVVAHLGAVQAQDYPAGLWAVGLRTKSATEADVERAVAEKAIVRTWPMRGTLHFVAAADVRWMLELLTPRVVSSAKGRYAQLELDDAAFSRAGKLAVKALRDGGRLTRAALYKVFERGGVSAADSRGLHIIGYLAQKGVLCFGPREGKQQTLVLLDEWLPEAKSKDRDESLAELAGRYFTSHGPATLDDFVWWTGLKISDARAAVAMAATALVEERVGDKTYWLAPSAPPKRSRSTSAYLLPVYDEYTVAYRDRSAVLDPVHAEAARNGIFRSVIAVDGRIAGVWTRELGKGRIAVTTSPFEPLGEREERAVAAAAERYGAFVGLPVSIAKSRTSSSVSA